MNLLLSLTLTLGLHRPVQLYGCCPVANVLVWRVVPVLVVVAAPPPPPAVSHEPREMGAVPHVARI